MAGIRLLDVSHRGFSFALEEELPSIDTEQPVTIVVQSEELPIVCEVLLCHQEEQFGRTKFGASIRFMSSSNIRTLYAFMFSNQL